MPENAPKELRDFVSGKTSDVSISEGPLDWVPGKPELKFAPGTEPGSIDISAGFFNLTASIEDGNLVVDSMLGSLVTDWVDSLNSGRQFDGISIEDGQLHLSARPIPATVTEDSQTPIPSTPPKVAVTPLAATPPTVLGPKPTTAVKAFHDHWKKAGAGVLALGVAAFFLFGDGEAPVEMPNLGGQETDAADTPQAPSDGESAEIPQIPSNEDSADDPQTPSDGGTESSPGGAGDDSWGAPADPESEETGAISPPGGFFGETEGFGSAHGAPGVLVLIQPDPVGDYNYCGQSNASGADMGGVVVYQNSVVSAGVLVQPQEDDFSNANIFQALFSSELERTFIYQVHDGEFTIGEMMPNGTIDPGSDVDAQIVEDGVWFTFSHDPTDPVTHVMAQAFNMGQEGDSIGCDLAYGAASPSPMPPSDRLGDCTPTDTVLCLNDRFSAEVAWNDSSATGPGGSELINSDSGHFWSSGDSHLLVRAVNGCGFDENYWIFATPQGVDPWELIVIDTVTGTTTTYENALGEPTQPIQDTTAFATCP